MNITALRMALENIYKRPISRRGLSVYDWKT